MTLDSETAIEGMECGVRRCLYSEAFGRTDQDFDDINMLLQHPRAQIEDAATDIARDIQRRLSQNWQTCLSDLVASMRSTFILNLDYSQRTDQQLPFETRKELIYKKLVEGSTTEERLEQTENSTTQPEQLEGIEQLIDVLFNEAVDQDFEDGMESEFSRELLSLVRRYGDLAMSEIAYLITWNRANPEVSSEALRWLGRMDHLDTRVYRLWLLEESLGSESAWVRDGAALGLASMGDPHAIPYIEKAIDQEDCVELREDLKQVLKHLEASQHALLSKDGSQT